MNLQPTQSLDDHLRPDERPLSTPEVPRRVLVAITSNGASAIALQRADRMARILGAELYVLHVMPAPWISALFPHRNTVDSVEALEAIRAAEDTTHQFCELMLARAFDAARVIVRRGVVSRRILEVADELDAGLIVIGAESTSGLGERTKVLLRKTGRPILVARSAVPASAIVAATDFSDWSFPALTRAADLGARLQAPVTFVHNVDWSSEIATVGVFSVPFFSHRFKEAMTKKRTRLRRLAERMGGLIDVVVLDRDRATDAILEIACVREAELVVIGMHHRSALHSLVGQGTAESVVASTDRSVLAVPIRDAA